VQRPLTCGPSGWPAGQTPWPADPTLQSPVSFLGDDALQEVVEWNPRPGVSGERAPWPTGHVARPAGQHLRITNLIKSVIAPGTPINTPCRWNSNTTLYLYFSTCKGSSFIVEVQAKPYWESRVELSLRSSSGSSHSYYHLVPLVCCYCSVGYLSNSVDDSSST
jgi:hypothetical protein